MTFLLKKNLFKIWSYCKTYFVSDQHLLQHFILFYVRFIVFTIYVRYVTLKHQNAISLN